MANEHQPWRELAEGYVIGGLDDRDRQAFASHLAGCDTCQREVRELAHVAEGLGRALDPIEPPPALRARVLEMARREMPGAAAQPSRSRAGVGTAWPAWIALAASIIAVISGAAAWNFKREADSTRAQLESVQRQIGQMEQRIATLQDAASQARQTSVILTAVDLSRVELAGLPAAPVSAGRVFWSASSGFVFSATNLPALPPGRVYQLWIITEAPVSAGIVTPDETGRLNVVSTQPVPQRPKAFAVTQEPAGGRPSPTGPMFLMGSS